MKTGATGRFSRTQFLNRWWISPNEIEILYKKRVQIGKPALVMTAADSKQLIGHPRKNGSFVYSHEKVGAGPWTKSPGILTPAKMKGATVIPVEFNVWARRRDKTSKYLTTSARKAHEKAKGKKSGKKAK